VFKADKWLLNDCSGQPMLPQRWRTGCLRF
jgi:hypothetical protein